MVDGDSLVGVVVVMTAFLALGWGAWRSGGKGFPLVIGCLAGMVILGSLHLRCLNLIHSFPLGKTVYETGGLAVSGEGWIVDEPEFGERSVSTSVRLTSFELRGREIACDHILPTWIQQTPENLRYGTALRFEGFIRPLEGRKAPGGFNPREFYFRDSGSLARLEIRDGDDLEILEDNRGSRLIAFAQRSRRKMESALKTGLREGDERYANLIAAMTLGIRENAPEDLQDLFRLSGTMHLFAVSGMHVAVVAGILVGTLLFLRVPRRWAVLIAIPLVLFYAVLTGLRPSAIRAAVMVSVFLAGYAVREKPRLLNSIGFAGLAILAFDTQQLFLPGFQLSFLVVLFIAIFVDGLRVILAKPFLPDPFIPRKFLSPPRRLVDLAVGAVAALLALSLVSWIGSVGLLTWHFQSIAPVGIIANLFMVPLAGMVIGVAAFSVVCSGINLVWLAVLANKLTVGLAVLLTGFAQYFSSLPGANLHTGDFTDRTGESLIIDVMGERGEGAILMTLIENSGQRTSWMIDCGGHHSYRRHVLPTLRSRGVNRLDALFLTHGDSGHIGAGPEIVQLLRPRVVIESTSENRSPVYSQIRATVDNLGVETVRVERGQRIMLGEKIAVRILAPAKNSTQRLADDRSLVMKVEYAEHSLLLTSDAGFDTEKNLLRTGVDVSADVWIRGQHREAPSGLPAFIKAVSPTAVISSHSEFPASETIPEGFRENLTDAGARLFDTDSGGIVTIEVGPESLRVTPFSTPGSQFEQKSSNY